MELGPDHLLAQLDDVLTPQPPAPPARWQAPAAECLGWRHWNDDYVVYNTLSADTHLLSGDAGAVLMALLEGPGACTPNELLSRVSGDVPVDADELAALHEILAGLERIGLASRTAT